MDSCQANLARKLPLGKIFASSLFRQQVGSSSVGSKTYLFWLLAYLAPKQLMAAPPTVEDVERTLGWAYWQGLKLLSVPPWIVPGHLTEGTAVQFHSFCFHCSTWMLWEESLDHAHICKGQCGDDRMAAKMTEWREWFEQQSPQQTVHPAWRDLPVVQSTVNTKQTAKSTVPTPAEVRSAFASAESTQLECIHKLPKGIVLGRVDGQGKRKREHFAYCMRCSLWLACNHGEALSHACEGVGWDEELAVVADEWEPQLKQMRYAEAWEIPLG